MFSYLTRRKRLIGGLYFGPPAWLPTEIEDATEPSQLPDYQITKLSNPQSRPALLSLLSNLNLHNTSPITPGLLEQLQHAGSRSIRTLILNLLPTQPEFALPAALSRLALPEILAGLHLIQQVIQPRRTLILIDRHDFRTRRLWRRARKTSAKSSTQKITFDLKPLLNQYPYAHPTLLMRRLFARRLPVGRLPIRLNRMILDPVTCWALGRHLKTAQPFTQRPVQLFTQAGGAAKDSSARLVLAKLGESISTLLHRYGITTDPTSQVILNGMLAGQLIDPAITRVASDTESIALRETPIQEIPTPCFACGWCVDVCPTSLNPVSLLQLAEQAQHAPGGPDSPAIAAELRTPRAHESLHCIGCGLCSYVCPTRLPLTQQTLRLRSYVENSHPPRPS